MEQRTKENINNKKLKQFIGEFNHYIFNTTGLKHSDDTEKPAYEYWKTI